ncbi:MAG: hypothetical protein U5K77_02925 [Candidatus Saccharibacteria bacterium]|nr:hypothetical protein [Candidatus Saccharibacteria bacterium]
MERIKQHKGGAAITVVFALLVGFVFAFGGSNDDDSSASADESPTTTTTEAVEETTTTTEAECPTWELEQRSSLDAEGNETHRIAPEEIEAIRTASNEEEARIGAHDWVQWIRTDPELLAGNLMLFLDREVDPNSLFDEEGCATQEAEVLISELETAIAMSAVRPDEAPAEGFNSGVDEHGNVVVSADPGVRGDRTAILIELPNGKKIWVMSRCGNPVTTAKPPLPEGPTDNPPPDDDGKDHNKSPASDDRNDPDERVRPNIPVEERPDTVIRPEPEPGTTTTTQPPPPTTLPEDPPEVSDPPPPPPELPEDIRERDSTNEEPEEVCETDAMGFPVDSC